MTSTTNSDADVEGELPGLKLATEVITPDEEARLISLIDSCNPRTYAGDGLGGLRAISFGWAYDVGSGTFAPTDPIPEAFADVRAVAARFAGLAPEDFVQILLNRYQTGAEIPWHCDKPIWEDVVGVSLGAETTMQFRRSTADGYRYGQARLRPRSIYLLSGEVREVFDHSIPPMPEPRWSITFRTFSDHGRSLRDALAAPTFETAKDQDR